MRDYYKDYTFIEDLKTIDDNGYLNEVVGKKWLLDKIRKGKSRVKAEFMKPGQFYTFEYDSKLYENKELPFYDERPVILVVSKNNKYVLGLNMNYLPIRQQKRFINKLKKRYPNQWDENKILPNVSWNTVKKEVDYNETMVHMYIKNRLGRPVQVKNTDAERLAKLDMSKFKGIDVRTVWRNYQDLTPLYQRTWTGS
jgi:hypothetical protein